MPILIRIALIIAFSLISVIGISQNKNVIDSLVHVLSSDLSDKDRIMTMVLLARNSEPVDALDYAMKAKALAISLDEDELLAKAYEEISLNQRVLGNIASAFDASFQALNIYQNLGFERQVAEMNEQIGTHYSYDGNYEKAKVYLNLALRDYRVNRDTIDIILTAINLGETYRMSGELDSAIIHFEESLALEKFVKDELIYAYAIGNLGLVHSVQELIDTSLVELKTATRILEKLGDPYAASYYKSEIGKIYISQKKNQEGKKLLEESLTIAQGVGLKEQIRDINKTLAEYYESIHDYKNALLCRKQYEVYNDSLVNIDNVRKIESLRADYDIGQKQNEVTLLSQANRNQRNIAYLLSATILGFLGFSYFLFRSNNRVKKANITLSEQKESITKREEEKALLLKELNHRVKNNLQMVASLLNLQSNQIADKEATQALESGKLRVEALSLIHQKLYSKDHHTTIKVKEYIEELVQNLVYTFNEEVAIQFDIDDLSIDIDRAIPIGLIVNELCTNALKYAFDEVDEPLLSISLKTDEINYVLSIADNGIGMVENVDSTSKSFGLKLTKSLANQIGASLIFINQGGCKWQLEMPKANIYAT